jgi:hypothetical protein
LRDEREALQNELKRSGNHTLIRNVDLVIRGDPQFAPLTDRLEPKDPVVDETVLQVVASAPVPIRWIIRNFDKPLIGALRKRLDTESLESAYYRAKFPVVSSSTLSPPTHIHEWIHDLTNERARSRVAIVWVCADFGWLGTLRVLDKLLSQFQDASFEFVACVKSGDTAVARSIVELPRVVEIQVQP